MEYFINFMQDIAKGIGQIAESITYFYYPPSPRYNLMSDKEAIRNAWQRTGDDIRNAMHQFEEENPDITDNIYK